MELKEFNLDEYKEIKDPSALRKSMFIQASAGTGKTYTITGIIKKLVKENFDLEKILVVTYTEKAAGELRDRIRKACPDKDVDNAPIFTIHSFCSKTLSEFSFTANQCANLSVIEENKLEDFFDGWVRDHLAQEPALKELFKTAKKQSTLINNLKRDFKQAVSKYYLNNENDEVEEIVSLDDIYIHIEKGSQVHDYTYRECDALIEQAEIEYESVKKEYDKIFSGLGTKTNLEKVFDYKVSKFYLSQLKALYSAWQQEKANNKSQSYNDMLRNVREAVCSKNSNLKKQLQKKYDFAIIDEFQDTNQLQWDIFKTVFMEDDDHTIIVVGDPKQSIYAFQGADVNVYLNATKAIYDNRGLACSLSKNFRSTDSMVKGCNHLFRNFFNPDAGINFSDSKESKTKAAALYNEEEIKPIWIAGSPDCPISEEDFAKLTVQTIVDCCTWENGKTKLQVFDKEKEDAEGKCLELRNVSFRDFAILVRSGSEAESTEKALKKSGIPYLRYKDKNLFHGKECSQWISIFNAITARDFTGHNRSILSEALFTDFFSIPLEELENETFDNPSSLQRQMIIQWQQLAQQRKWAKLLEKIYADTNIENKLSQLDQMQTLSKIRQIGNYAVDYLYKTDSSLEDACKHLQRLSSGTDDSLDADGNIVEKGTDFDSVQLMTIHASKGLEFPVVIVPAGCRKTPNNPQAYLYHNENNKAKLSFSPYGKDQMAKEAAYERERLFYVAYTRASSLLMLPLYDGWLPAPRNEKAKLYSFLKENITALFNFKEKDEKGNEITYVKEVHDNNKVFRELKDEVKIILEETKKVREEEKSSCQTETDLTEDSQRTASKNLSEKIPSLILHKHSYASLSHKKTETEEMTENGGRADKEGENPQTISLAEFDMAPNPLTYTALPDNPSASCPQAESAPHNYPKGTKLGIAIHEVFEKADFKAGKDDEDLKHLINSCFENQTLRIPENDPNNWLTYTANILWNTFNAKLPEITGSRQTGRYFSLKDLDAQDKISETEFNMNITAASPLLKNYCNGFIDLIFKRKVDGKDLYSVLDWKSNTFEANQYSSYEALKKETDDKYSIQRVLYSYSLIKWLASFYKDQYKSDTEAQVFENHFGGIYYVYVRGCQADTCSGIYARTWKNWQELESAFKKILKEFHIAD